MENAKLSSFLSAMSDENANVKLCSAKMVLEYRKCRDPFKWNKSLIELESLGISKRRLQSFVIGGIKNG